MEGGNKDGSLDDLSLSRGIEGGRFGGMSRRTVRNWTLGRRLPYDQSHRRPKRRRPVSSETFSNSVSTVVY